MNSTVVLGKRIRHLSRYREIAYILIRNGFGWFIDEIGLAGLLAFPKRLLGQVSARESWSTYERIRLVVEQLGPTFVKIGQVASLRTDLLPVELTDQLSKLRDDVPPMPTDMVRNIVASELGGTLSDWFSDFESKPIGSASIGQVHKARLLTGEFVAVKVQRPDIRGQIAVDFEILADIVRLAERHFEWASLYDLSEVVEEFRRTLLDECDYTIEARNAKRVRLASVDSDYVVIPAVNWEMTTEKVLVMEYVDGIQLGDAKGLREAQLDPKLLAARACNTVFTQILVHGFFHADPHPGNLAALPGNRVAFLDFGMVGRLTPEMKRRLGTLIIALMRRNTVAIVRALTKMGVVPSDIDERRLQRDIEHLREKYYDVPLSQINIGSSIRDIFTVAYKHHIRIPADLSLVAKTLVTIEGLVETLDPTFRIMDVAETFGRRLLWDQLNPQNVTSESLSALWSGIDSIVDFPRQILSLVRDIRGGKVKVQVETPQIHGILKKLDRVTNRISFSVMILALSIFMAGLMIASSLAKPSQSVWRLPFTDIGLVVGSLMVILLIWSIFKSGRL